MTLIKDLLIDFWKQPLSVMAITLDGEIVERLDKYFIYFR